MFSLVDVVAVSFAAVLDKGRAGLFESVRSIVEASSSRTRYTVGPMVYSKLKPAILCPAKRSEAELTFKRRSSTGNCFFLVHQEQGRNSVWELIAGLVNPSRSILAEPDRPERIRCTEYVLHCWSEISGYQAF